MVVESIREVAMWVFSRKAGEKIHIGDKVTVTVRRVVGNRVTLVIEVPTQN